MSRFIGNVATEEFVLNGAMSRLERLQQLQTRIQSAPTKAYVIFNAPATRISLEEVGVDYKQLALESISIGMGAAIAGAIAVVLAIIYKCINMITGGSLGVGGGGGGGGGGSGGGSVDTKPPVIPKLPAKTEHIKPNNVAAVAMAAPEPVIEQVEHAIDVVESSIDGTAFKLLQGHHIKVWGHKREHSGYTYYDACKETDPGATEVDMNKIAAAAMNPMTLGSMKRAHNAHKAGYFHKALLRLAECCSAFGEVFAEAESICDDETNGEERARREHDKLSAIVSGITEFRQFSNDVRSTEVDLADMDDFLSGTTLQRAADEAKQCFRSMTRDLRLAELAKLAEKTSAAYKEKVAGLDTRSQVNARINDWRLHFLFHLGRVFTSIVKAIKETRGYCAEIRYLLFDAARSFNFTIMYTPFHPVNAGDQSAIDSAVELATKQYERYEAAANKMKAAIERLS